MFLKIPFKDEVRKGWRCYNCGKVNGLKITLCKRCGMSQGISERIKNSVEITVNPNKKDIGGK